MIKPHLRVGVFLAKDYNIEEFELDVRIHLLYKETLCTTNDELSRIHESIFNDDDFISQIKVDQPYELCLIRCDENIGDWRIYDYEEVNNPDFSELLPY